MTRKVKCHPSLLLPSSKTWVYLQSSEESRAQPLVEEQRGDLSGCWWIIFHFIIPSVAASVGVSVGRLRYITRARRHDTQGGTPYLPQGGRELNGQTLI